MVAIKYLLRKSPDFDARVAVVPQSDLQIQEQTDTSKTAWSLLDKWRFRNYFIYRHLH